MTLAIYQWQRLGLSKYDTMKKCEKRLFYNLNVTEIRYPAFPMLFPEFSVSPSGSYLVGLRELLTQLFSIGGRKEKELSCLLPAKGPAKHM